MQPGRIAKADGANEIRLIFHRRSPASSFATSNPDWGAAVAARAARNDDETDAQPQAEVKHGLEFFLRISRELRECARLVRARPWIVHIHGGKAGPVAFPGLRRAYENRPCRCTIGAGRPPISSARNVRGVDCRPPPGRASHYGGGRNGKNIKHLVVICLSTGYSLPP